MPLQPVVADRHVSFYNNLCTQIFMVFYFSTVPPVGSLPVFGRNAFPSTHSDRRDLPILIRPSVIVLRLSLPVTAGNDCLTLIIDTSTERMQRVVGLRLLFLA